MNKETLSELAVAAVLTLLVVSLLDPFMYWMPGDMEMIILVFVVVAFFVFALFMWRERSVDEREAYHRMLASRYAWFAGAAVLVIGLVVQGLQHAIDQWLVYALLAMVIAKVGMRMYGRNNH